MMKNFCLSCVALYLTAAKIATGFSAPAQSGVMCYHGESFYSRNICSTRNAAAGFGLYDMSPPTSNDTGTALGQDGSD